MGWIVRAVFRPLYLLVAALLVAVVGGAGGVIYFEVEYSGRAFPGVHLQGTDLSGLRPEEIFRVAQGKAAYFQTPSLTLRIGDRSATLRPADFGAQLDPAETTQRALQIGRRGDLLTRAQEQAETWWKGVDVAPVVLLEDGPARRVMERMAEEALRQPVDASITVENGAVREIPAQNGEALDTAISLNLVRAAVTLGRKLDLVLPVQPIAPRIASATAAANEAKRIMSQDLVVLVPKWDANGALAGSVEAFRIRGVDLPDFVAMEQQVQGNNLVMKTALRRDKLRGMIEPLAPAVAQAVQEPRFTVDDATGVLQNILPSKIGRALDVEATLNAIEAALNTDNRQVTLVVQTVQPKVATDATAQQLGVTRLITEATTYFKGSSAARLKNVQVAAARFHGILVPPHATFSFNEFLGDVSEKDGFEEGLVIVGDRTIKGVGGGVCQVSTTAYQAALRSGFPIVERYPHGYRVSYYERGMGPGFDSTVFSPYVDLKFVNEFDSWLLIETYFDGARATLTFKFYGTPDGREVAFTEPVISDVVPHGPDIYEADTDNQVAAGQAKKVEYPVDGAKITWDRTVTLNGQTLIQETVVSKYVQWQAVYRYGPGFTPPEGSATR
jgi:vancomycin resistance protein YoaR